MCREKKHIDNFLCELCCSSIVKTLALSMEPNCHPFSTCAWDWVYLNIHWATSRAHAHSVSFVHILSKIYTDILVIKNISIHHNVSIHRYIDCLHEIEIQMFTKYKIRKIWLDEKVGQTLREVGQTRFVYHCFKYTCDSRNVWSPPFLTTVSNNNDRYRSRTAMGSKFYT